MCIFLSLFALCMLLLMRLPHTLRQNPEDNAKCLALSSGPLILKGQDTREVDRDTDEDQPRQCCRGSNQCHQEIFPTRHAVYLFSNFVTYASPVPIYPSATGRGSHHVRSQFSLSYRGSRESLSGERTNEPC